MAQNNSNLDHVTFNDADVLGSNLAPNPFAPTKATTSNVIPTAAGAASIQTVLNDANSGNVDGTNLVLPMGGYNDDYSAAVNYTDEVAVAGRTNTAQLLTNHVDGQGGEFLPTEGALRAAVAGEFNPAAAATVGNYFNAASWTAVPKASEVTGNASAFTFNHTDGGKTVTLSETISGSPFTTGNGAVSEALTFRGTASDTLVVKHNVAVANVPALTNNNNGSALDVRNETYAESYAKQGVTSSYVQNTAHKYAEVNGNQALNDAFVQNYVYNDANLTINSAVKTAVADAAYINGVERIVENNVANYNYAHKTTGSVNYVVTDTRNLAQVDQRTWTNTTVTNVAKFEVKDLVNATTISAKGLVTGTTTNLSTAANAATPTTFKATNAAFNVSSDHYTLTVDPKEFGIDHVDVASNALLTLVDDAKGSDVFNSALGNVPAGQVSMADAFNPYVTVLTKDAAGVATSDQIIGTRFNDTITVNDKLAFGGNISGGAGNDTITGGSADDTITGGAGADSIVGGAGTNVLTGEAGQDTFVVSGTDTINDFKPATPAVVDDVLTTTVNEAKAEIINDTLIVNAGATAEVSTDGHTFLFVTNPTGATAPLVITTQVQLDAAKGLDSVVDYSDSTKGETLTGGAGNDTITGGSADDTITGGAGNDSITSGSGNDNLTGKDGNDTVKAGDGADTLFGGTGLDLLEGGDGKDVFGFTGKLITSLGADTIADFVTNDDRIQLDSSIFTGVKSLSATPDSNNYAESSVPLSATTVDLNGTSTSKTGGIVVIGADNGTAGVEVYYTSNMNAVTDTNSTLIVALTGLNTTQVDVTDLFGI